MNTHRRRCRSEQVPLHVRRAIPPHKAAILRQAQLRQAQQVLLPQHDLTKTTRIHIGYTDEKDTAPETDHSSASVVSKQADFHDPSLTSRCLPVPSHRNDSKFASQQERITNRFQSIDTVIAEPKDPDTRRKLGETEFYEYTGDDGVIRRRSMMRTVAKDDLLVARGANPRTGLITPDWNSVASSVENDYTYAVRRDRPSAQWKLDGDAWVSVQPEERVLDSGAENDVGINESEPHLLYPDTAQARRTASGTGSAVALTARNLRTLSDQIRPQQSPLRDPPYDSNVTRESQIKRKPVGGPVFLPPVTGVQARITRNISGDTVVHSPTASDVPVPERTTKFPYFSPETVGEGLTRSDATNFPQRARNGGPFLGLPVESRSMTLPPPRGFTKQNESRDHFLQSLRTSSGPYPSHLSSRSPMEMKTSQSLHMLQDRRTQHMQRIDPRRGCPSPPQPVQKACLPDTLTFHSLTKSQSQLQDYPGPGFATRKTQPRHGGRPIIVPERDGQFLRSNSDLQDSRTLSIRPTRTGMIVSTRQERLANSALAQQHNHTALRPGIFSHRSRVLGNDTEKMPHAVVNHLTSRLHHLSNMDEEPLSARRPQLGSRAQGMLQIPKIRVEATGTELEVRLNSTGTASAHVDEGDEKGTVEELIADLKDTSEQENTIQRMKGPAVHFSGPAILKKESIIDPDRQVSAAIKDHSVCCPECCTAYDCHDGCLGHSKSDVSVADTETSSLVSMGVFDTSFETSVKAVNMAFLTPADKSSGKLAKIRTALNWRSGPSSPTRSSPRPSMTKRTLRDEPLSQKVNIGLIRHPQTTDLGTAKVDITQAQTAAVKTQAMTRKSLKTSPTLDTCQREAKSRSQVKTKTKEDAKEKCGTPPEANKSRRISGKGLKVGKNKGVNPDSHVTTVVKSTVVGFETVDNLTTNEKWDGHDDSHNANCETMSMIDRVNSFIRKKSCISGPSGMDLNFLANPEVLNHLRSILIVFKDMAVTVAGTTSVVVEMAVEYNRTRKVVLPVGTNASEVAGNLLRSALYLMIIACVYALCVKTWRTILAVLRVVLLPVRICAWIIG